MCTAITWNGYFGRNLDLWYSYGESVVITPRNYPFSFRLAGEMAHHYALIGIAHVADGVPLYYEATNEKGLSVAGLNFPGNACYDAPAGDGKADYTVYSCCCDIMRGVYYYKTYENNRITATHLHGADLSGDTLKGYPMDRTPDIRYVT